MSKDYARFIRPKSRWQPVITLVLLFLPLQVLLSQGVPLWDFYAGSQEARLDVVAVDEKETRSGMQSRGVYRLADGDADADPYQGDYWTTNIPFAAGDTVDGRYRPSTGEMMPAEILSKRLWTLAVPFISMIFIIALVVYQYRHVTSKDFHPPE